MTTIFPYIEHIDDLKSKVQHLPEIRFTTHPNGYHTACYMIGNNEMWNDENAPWVRECRGITFYPDGRIASRSLHKFFNVGERPDTQRGVIDWEQSHRLMDKRDGSMITPVIVHGNILLKSKKSFTSDVAHLANNFLATRANYQDFCRDMLSANRTPIFEYTSPFARIVINYQQEELVLLHVRNNVTGDYDGDGEIEYLGKLYGIPTVSTFTNSELHSRLDELPTIENIEGYVVQFENGEMVKAKSKWYLDLHHTVTFITERNVAEMVLSETLDDYKSYLAESNSVETLAKVEEIETQISKDITQVEEEVEQIVAENKHLSKKEFAMTFSKHKLFGLLMLAYDGREPNYTEWYRRWHLKNKFSTTQI